MVTPHFWHKKNILFTLWIILQDTQTNTQTLQPPFRPTPAHGSCCISLLRTLSKSSHFRMRKLQNNNMFPASILKFSPSKMIGFVLFSSHEPKRPHVTDKLNMHSCLCQQTSYRNELPNKYSSHLQQEPLTAK